MERVEKRRRPRYAHQAPIVYRELGTASIGTLHDLNEGGMMAFLTQRFSVGTPMDLVISLGERSVRAQAEVVWSSDSCRGNGREYPHRLRFTRVEFHDQLNLELFIALVLDRQGKASEAEGRL
jgi:hypothetical protein